MKIGDIVTLKSGGPLMTVNCFDDQGRVQVVWFSAWPPSAIIDALQPHAESEWFSQRALAPIAQSGVSMRPVEVDQPTPAPGRHHIGLVGKEDA